MRINNKHIQLRTEAVYVLDEQYFMSLYYVIEV